MHKDDLLALKRSKLPMKITEVEQFVVAVPHIEPIQKHRPQDYTERPISIIKVHTDEGIYGLGESGRRERFDDAVERGIGLTPMTLKWQDLGGGFGSATFDIVGKALGIPAHKLMGAQHWEEVPVGYWSCPMEPVEFAAEAEKGAKLGLMTKTAGPDYGIIVDPNYTFETLEESIRLAHELEKYNIETFEDPFSDEEYRWDNYRQFRRQTNIPLAPHLDDFQKILEAIKANAADMFNTGGSPSHAANNAGIAETDGMPI